MDRVEVSTLIYVPREEVYDFVTDFPRYAEYSNYLREVTQEGSGGPGTCYNLHFAWWKLNYTARSKVVSAEPPDQLDWQLVRDISADGTWFVDAEPDSAPDGHETATRARLRVEFDTDSARSGAIDVPRFVSFDWVLGKVKPLIVEEAKRVVAGMVQDLEGESRPVELTIHDRPDSI